MRKLKGTTGLVILLLCGNFLLHLNKLPETPWYFAILTAGFCGVWGLGLILLASALAGDS